MNDDHRNTELDRPIGLMGATAMVVGGVIGMGIYALVAEVTAQVGTTIWLPFLLAMIVMVLGIVPTIQISAALPRAGAAYVYTSRLLHPLLGTVVSWLCIISIACSSAYVSIGMAGYIAPYLPFEISRSTLSLILPALFLLLYLSGLRVASTLQIALTAFLMLALFAYGFAGAVKTELSITTTLPQGTGGLIIASIICYSIWFGLTVVAEIGEEIRNAKRNIPLSILIGGLLILVTYIIVGTVFANSVAYDPEAISAMTAPLRQTGEAFLPRSLVELISLGALAAALTTFNATAIAMPREFFAQARDGILPSSFARVSKKTKSPFRAVAAYFAVVFLLLGFGIRFNLEMDFFAVMSAQGLLIMMVLVAVASLRLPKKYPDYYERAYFKIPKSLLWILVILAGISSLGFFALTLSERPIPAIILTGLALCVAVFHVLRVRAMKRNGVDWEDRIRGIPGHDEE